MLLRHLDNRHDCQSRNVVISNDITVSNQAPFVLFGGINVLEDSIDAGCLRAIRRCHGTPGDSICVQGSFDKANRSSMLSYRGVGLDEGLRIRDGQAALRRSVLTDVHEIAQAKRLRTW